MRRNVLSPIGIEINLQLRDVDNTAVVELQRVLAEHGVMVMPGQDIDDSAFVIFLTQFGDLTFSTGETPVAGFPDLNVVSNVGRKIAPRSVFHADTTYVRMPPAYTALRAVQIPVQGGNTLFTNQYRAFDTLPAEVRADLAGRTITHVVTGLDLGADDETTADHPVFRRHPISGRTALYMSTPQRCVGVSGMGETEAARTIEFLYAHSTAMDNIYRHSWSPGDVVMWDNGCVLHRADHDGVVGNRVMHRGMVAGYAGSGK